MAHQTRFGPRLLYSTSIMARFTQFEFLRRIVCRIPQLNLRHSLQQHVLSLCLHHMAVFKMFVAEIKGSEQRAIRSCVLLQIARPQPPPEKKTETGTGIGVLALPGVWSAFLSLHVWGCAAFCSDHCPIVRLRAPHTWGLDKQILQKTRAARVSHQTTSTLSRTTTKTLYYKHRPSSPPSGMYELRSCPYWSPRRHFTAEEERLACVAPNCSKDPSKNAPDTNNAVSRSKQ